VHVDHGVGRLSAWSAGRSITLSENIYVSSTRMKPQLFVPIHQVDRMTRYVGSDNRPPVADRLGGVEWRSTKAQVKAAVQEVAQDLLELYAKRAVVDGYPFGQTTPGNRS